MIAYTSTITRDSQIWPTLVNDDGTLVYCEGCELPILNYEVVALLDGNPVDCYFADDVAGVVIERVPQSASAMSYPKARTGKVELQIECTECARRRTE